MPTGMTWQGVPAFLAHLTGDRRRRGRPRPSGMPRPPPRPRPAPSPRSITPIAAPARSPTACRSRRPAPARASITTAPHTRYFEYGTRYMAGARVFRPAATEAGAAYLAAAERRVHAPLILR